MSSAAKALKEAIELEKKALEKYHEAVAHSNHKETKAELEKIAAEKSAQIDSLHWMIMAEDGKLETGQAEEKSEAKPASKCPFSGALAEMGIDISKMSEMPNAEDMEKMMGMAAPKDKPAS